MMMTEDTRVASWQTFGVWVGCLECYTSGQLAGQWIEAEHATDWDCPRHPGGERQIFDVDGFPLDECSPHTAAEWGRVAGAVVDEGLPLDAFAAYVSYMGRFAGPDVLLNSFADAYVGELSGTFEDFAYNLGHELLLCQCEQSRSGCYFDAAKFAEELLWGDYFVENDYIFLNL